ncbi:uncharacterized protein A4U43_C08F2660 [Asparagus officinalis]|nr:uncharacterized protein A4U43_C08F2660 [Asparagus officinalis]
MVTGIAAVGLDDEKMLTVVMRERGWDRLEEIVDPTLRTSFDAGELEVLGDIAGRCVGDRPGLRPSMGEILRIMRERPPRCWLWTRGKPGVVGGLIGRRRDVGEADGDCGYERWQVERRCCWSEGLTGVGGAAVRRGEAAGQVLEGERGDGGAGHGRGAVEELVADGEGDEEEGDKGAEDMGIFG